MINIVKILVLIGVAVSIASAYEICAPKESGTFHRDYSSCQSYIACSNGKSYPGVCPKQYMFNPVKSSCDFPYNVKCDQSCPTTGNTAFSLGKSCTKYIQCIKGKATFEECKIGYVFDAKTKSCMPHEKASCPFGGKCPDPRIDYSWASEDTCEGYFACKKGKYSANACDNGLHYNAAKQKCDTPANAKCPIVTNKEVEMEDVEVICPKTGYQFFPHVLNCSHYYVCYEGIASLMACNRGLKYDFASQQCDLPARATCISDALANPKKETPADASAPSDSAAVSTQKEHKKSAKKPTENKQ